MELNKLDISYYGKKSYDSVVRSNNATYSKLYVPVVPNIINMLICE